VTIGVFLVDDHEMVRRGLADIINQADDMLVVGEAGTIRQAEARISATGPDVAVLDMRLPDGNGIDLCRRIRSASPEVACLILTAYDDDAAAHAAVLAGAAGYILKNVSGITLLHDIRAVHAGDSVRTESASRFAAARVRAAAEDPRLGSLGLREKQILRLIADGLTNRQIADALGLAEKTVKNYISSLFVKLGVASRTQAAIFQFAHPD